MTFGTGLLRAGLALIAGHRERDGRVQLRVPTPRRTQPEGQGAEEGPFGRSFGDITRVDCQGRPSRCPQISRHPGTTPRPREEGAPRTAPPRPPARMPPGASRRARGGPDLRCDGGGRRLGASPRRATRPGLLGRPVQQAVDPQVRRPPSSREPWSIRSCRRDLGSELLQLPDVGPRGGDRSRGQRSPGSALDPDGQRAGQHRRQLRAGLLEEAWANIQSASALIQNMSLAAHALGLGPSGSRRRAARSECVRRSDCRWIDSSSRSSLRYSEGPAEARAEAAPPRSGHALRALRRAPHPPRPTPRTGSPTCWQPISGRVLTGLRHNKPRAWEVRALDEAIDALVPDGVERPEAGQEGEDSRGRWLDVLLHGDHHGAPRHAAQGLPLRRRGAHGGGRRVLREPRQPEGRELRLARGHGRRGRRRRAGGPARGAFDVVSCFFRVEGLRAADRVCPPRGHRSLGEARREVLPRFVSSRSYHGLTERMRARRGGPGGVEYVLSPDPGSALSSPSYRNRSRVR